MKSTSTQQEVLLITGTGFTAREYYEKNVLDNTELQTEKEHLMDVCWKGLLQDKLPEAFALADPDTQLFLWQMTENAHFLALEMGDMPADIDHFYSVDPYFFMAKKIYN